MSFDVAAKLAAEVDKNNIAVKSFDGYIFLCGGALESSKEGFASARHYAVARQDAEGKIAGHKVILAESMTNLLQGEDFQDLLEFEEHIAALCACVLIFVESPGSIAELGSFSVMQHLAPRLLVVCEQKFESGANPSFIFLGPVTVLRRRRAESVQIFPISLEDEAGQLVPDKELLDECWDYIEEAVMDSIKRPIPEALFQPNELAHQMVIVATVIDLGVALKIGEIEAALQGLGVVLPAKAIRRIVRMLEKFSLIEGKTYGREAFFHSRLGKPLVTFKSLRADSIFDPIRFKARVLDFYRENDERRSKAISAYQRGRRR